MKVKSFSILAVFLLLTCCGKKNTIQEKVIKTRISLDEVYSNAYDLCKESSDIASNMYRSKESFDLNIEKMDENRGGNYGFINESYQNLQTSDNAVIWASGFTPVDDSIKTEIKLMERIEERLKAVAKSSEYIDSHWLLSVHNIACAYPYKDLVSAIPPKLEFAKALPFFTLSIPENNPARQTFWFNIPILAISGIGWSQVVVSPIYVDDFFKGIMTVPISYSSIQKKLFTDLEDKIFLVTDKQMVLAISKSAQDFLGLEQLQFFYVEQQASPLKPHDQEKYLLSNKTPDIQKLGKNIVSGKSEFDVTINGTLYHIYIEQLSNPGFYVVGIE